MTGPCDASDYSAAADAPREGPTAIYLYDMARYGVGLAIEAFGRMADLVERAAERVRGCPCGTDEGCFQCVRNPQAEVPASKAATLALLEIIAANWRPHPWSPRPRPMIPHPPRSRNARSVIAPAAHRPVLQQLWRETGGRPVTPAPSITRLSATYPTARIRGRLITRLEEHSLGWAVLDTATADEMGREQLGWFVGNHPASRTSGRAIRQSRLESGRRRLGRHPAQPGFGK